MKIAESTKYDEQVDLAMELMKKQDFDGALKLVSKVVSDLQPNMDTLANASRLSAKARLMKAFKQQIQARSTATGETLSQAWELFSLSLQLDPDSQETKAELANLTRVYRQIAALPSPSSEAFVDVDVVIVGAGAAGIGCALMLTETFGLNKSRVMLIERGDNVGTTFERWPKEMRFISPSFNQQGWTPSFDLNSIHYGTSPAFSMHAEHPTGSEYAAYLRALAANHKLQVMPNSEVVSVEPDDDDEEMEKLLFVKTRKMTHDAKNELIMARYVVWAAGEFQYPRGGGPGTFAGVTSDNMETEEEKKSDKEVDTPATKQTNNKSDFPGSELCLHNSKVFSWASLTGDNYVIIGGYESGIDACYHLAKAGKKSTVLASTRCWRVKTADPSTELAPFTAGRLCEVMAPTFSPSPRLLAPLKVLSVEKKVIAADRTTSYVVMAQWKKEEKHAAAPLRSAMNAVPSESPGAAGSTVLFETPHPPILCSGFENSVKAAASNLFEFASNKDKKKGCLDGSPLLTKQDESTKVPGVFLVGPMVSHGDLSFCFVYKFRQRFAIVANAICKGLGLDTRAAIEECRKTHMYLDDLSCCDNTCGDVC